MNKWKCGICNTDFDNYQAQGFDGVIYCPLCYFKELYKREKQENQQLKEKLNCKEYFSSTMPEDTEFVILTKNNYDRQQKDLALENIKLKKQKDDVVEYIKTFKDDIRGLDEIVLLRMLGEIND